MTSVNSMTATVTRPGFGIEWVFSFLAELLTKQTTVGLEPAASYHWLTIASLAFHINEGAGKVSYSQERNGRHQFVFTNTGKPASKMTSTDWCTWYGKLVRHLVDVMQVESATISIDSRAPVMLVTATIGTCLMQGKIFPGTGTEEKDRKPWPTIYVNAPECEAEVAEGWARAMLANVQRFLGALPLNLLDTVTMSAVVRKLVDVSKGAITISEPSTEEYARMSLLQAVGSGSGKTPRVLILRVDPESGPTKKVNVDVGKGVSYDDGGPNYKGTDNIADMERDMMGAAAVLCNVLYWL